MPGYRRQSFPQSTDGLWDSIQRESEPTVHPNKSRRTMADHFAKSHSARSAKPKDPQKKPSDKKKLVQLVLDLGPATICKECGMEYHHEDDHAAYHKSQAITHVPQSSLSRGEHVGGFDGCVMLRFGNWRALRQHVHSILNRMNVALGVEDSFGIEDSATDVLYTTTRSRSLIGLLLVRRVDSSRPNDAEDDARREAIGVRRIWVDPRERRKGIATRMLDAMRASFAMGHLAGRNEIAFFSPTRDCVELARRFSGDHFLVCN